MSWEILWVLEDSPNLEKLLRQGWEPFATTTDLHGGVTNITRIWLRKKKYG